MGFQAEGVALVATRIWKGFPLILVTPLLFKGLVAIYQRICGSPVNPKWGCTSRIDMGAFDLVRNYLTKPSQTIHFPLPCLKASSAVNYGQRINGGALAGNQGRHPGVLGVGFGVAAAVR